ncbi:unnamed protein product [Penicillium palitans]
MLVLSNGEKVRQVAMEAIINSHPAVGSCLVARLFREYIWFAKPSKPFVRTDKSTVKRRDTVVLNEKEIEQFYKSMEEDGKLAANIDIASLATISESVHHLLTVAAAGVDPLVAFSISNSLRSSLGKYNCTH